jgi:hypothetical protein
VPVDGVATIHVALEKIDDGYDNSAWTKWSCSRTCRRWSVVRTRSGAPNQLCVCVFLLPGAIRQLRQQLVSAHLAAAHTQGEVGKITFTLLKRTSGAMHTQRISKWHYGRERSWIQRTRNSLCGRWKGESLFGFLLCFGRIGLFHRPSSMA